MCTHTQKYTQVSLQCVLQQGSPLPHSCTGTGAHPCHICAGTGPTPATSAPGLGSPLGHQDRGGDDAAVPYAQTNRRRLAPDVDHVCTSLARSCGPGADVGGASPVLPAGQMWAGAGLFPQRAFRVPGPFSPWASDVRSCPGGLAHGSIAAQEHRQSAANPHHALAARTRLCCRHALHLSLAEGDARSHWYHVYVYTRTQHTHTHTCTHTHTHTHTHTPARTHTHTRTRNQGYR